MSFSSACKYKGRLAAHSAFTSSQICTNESINHASRFIYLSQKTFWNVVSDPLIVSKEVWDLIRVEDHKLNVLLMCSCLALFFQWIFGLLAALWLSCWQGERCSLAPTVSFNFLNTCSQTLEHLTCACLNLLAYEGINMNISKMAVLLNSRKCLRMLF